MTSNPNPNPNPNPLRYPLQPIQKQEQMYNINEDKENYNLPEFPSCSLTPFINQPVNQTANPFGAPCYNNNNNIYGILYLYLYFI